MAIHTRGAANTRYVLKMGGLGVPIISFEPNVDKNETFFLGDASSSDQYTANYDGATFNGRPTSISKVVQINKTTTYQISEEFCFRIYSEIIATNPVLVARNVDKYPPSWNEVFKYMEIHEIVADLEGSILNNQITKYRGVIFQTWTNKGGLDNGSRPINGNIIFDSCTY